MTIYQLHLAQLQKNFETAMALANVSGVLIFSGMQKYPFRDDNGQRFNINPYFKYWLPLTSQVNSYLYIAPNQKPHLFLFQANDYWHAQPVLPEGEWQQHFELTIISQPNDLKPLLNSKFSNTAFIGEETDVAHHFGIESVNPENLLNYLDYQRAYKSDFEIDNMRIANQLAAKAHRAAKQAFYNGEPELSIHQRYLTALNIRETELPYNNIIALNENGAVLHYDHYQTTSPTQHRSFLIDAGASYQGYHSDISRTYVAKDYQQHAFASLYHAYQQQYSQLLEEIAIGKSYLEFHDSAHRRISQLLSDFDIVRCSGEQAYERGYSRVFFPCGVGHYIGLQVHDVGGYLANNGEQLLNKDPRYPYLRLMRPMEENTVFTVEPGIYFIDMLLAQHKDNADFNWSNIEMFKQFGGFRMEDCIALTQGKVENLSQQAFDGLK